MKKCRYCLEMIDEKLKICNHCEMYQLDMATTATSFDKRKHKRYETHLMIRYREPGDSMNKWDMTRAKDISAGGLSFAVSRKIPLNTLILTKLEPPIFGGQYSIETLARIQHIEGDKMLFKAGVAFATLDEETRNRLNKFLNFLAK
ncbi:MAG: PilZ domain-containing protein [Candidatus Omnitrophota bacterium]